MKCKLCNMVILEENQVDEDTRQLIHQRVDYYGLDSLTENEQVYIESGEMCCDCI